MSLPRAGLARVRTHVGEPVEPARTEEQVRAITAALDGAAREVEQS